MRWQLSLALAGVSLACTAQSPDAATSASAAAVVVDDRSASDTGAWTSHSASPRWGSVEPRLKALLGECAVEQSLVLAATDLAGRRVAGKESASAEVLRASLRRAGAPYVWPRTWALVGKDLFSQEPDKLAAKWLESVNPLGTRRCGVALVDNGAGEEALVIVAVDAIADLEPLPTSARTGQWLTFSAVAHIPIQSAQLVLLGPEGAPRNVTAQVSGANIRARFAPDRPGRWMVQLLPTTASGPRPALEADLFVDEKPPAADEPQRVPGEDILSGAPPPRTQADVEAAATKLLNAARASEGLVALTYDAALHAAAREHAQAMLKAGLLGHDVGNGGPVERLGRRGVKYRRVGENVVQASTLSRAHGALWASPAHRGNMLNARFRRVGVGAVREEDGAVWLCQIFAE